MVADARPATAESVWEAIAAPAWDPTRTAAVVDLARPVVGGGGTARAVIDTADHQRFRVGAPDGGFLRVSGAWHRGWRAEIDGVATRVYRADGLFRGVTVPPGNHTVEFRFENPPEVRGRAIGAVALFGLFAALIAPAVGRWRSRRAATPRR